MVLLINSSNDFGTKIDSCSSSPSTFLIKSSIFTKSKLLYMQFICKQFPASSIISNLIQIVKYFLGRELDMLNLSNCIYSIKISTISCFKDTHGKKAPSNKTPALTKSMNMDIWVVSESNELFIRGS